MLHLGISQASRTYFLTGACYVREEIGTKCCLSLPKLAFLLYTSSSVIPLSNCFLKTQVKWECFQRGCYGLHCVPPKDMLKS